jgi:hypothetical protein
VRLRIVATTLCAVLLELAVPSSAHAWWEYIEQLSGPGKFYGWDLQFRVYCVVDTVKNTKKSGETNTIEETKRFTPSSAGIVISFCRPQKKEVNKADADIETYYARRLSVDIATRFLSAKDDDFAHGQPIDLTILEPSVSMNLLNRWPKWDFVDVGGGAGVYWFASTEFPTFSGFILDPARIEFHPTTAMKESKWSALVPMVRLSWPVFVTGFERAKFVPREPLPLRIGRDAPFNLSLSFDLETLFR